MKNLLVRYPLPILLISLLFAVKAFYLSFWVTPLWDVPDEFGHYAYVQDLAEGRGVPLLGKSKINQDIIRNCRASENDSPVSNWIAQHPPVYYAIAAVPLKIGSWLTNDIEILYRLPRIVSVLSGALLLLVLFRTFRIIGLDVSRSTSIAAAVGFIPMVSHLSSGTNHDMTLFLFSALATQFLARYLIERNISNAYWCAFWLTMAAGTKMTAWVLLAPMVAIMIVELSGPIKNWAKHASLLSVVALFSPLAWMTRNLIYFGNPIYTSKTIDKTRLTVPLDHSFLEYLQMLPVLEHFMLNFYGILGFVGTGKGQLAWFQVRGLPLTVFSIVVFGLCCILLFYSLKLMTYVYKYTYSMLSAKSRLYWMGDKIVKNHYHKILIVVTFVLAFFIAGYIAMISYTTPLLLGHARILSISILIFVAIEGLVLLLFIYDPLERIALYGVVVFVFFGIIVLYQVYGVYLWDGRLRATHGRYFFPVIPFLLLSIAISVKRLQISAVLIAIGAVTLAYMELETYILQAIPYYLGGV
jgi:hypothetical protein